MIDQPLWLVCVLIVIAAIAGNLTGYAIGRKAGPTIFKRPESRWFKQEHVDQTYAFFERYGPGHRARPGSSRSCARSSR